ncbi:UDP-N-acetylmuramoylalanine--D-glutamate ligase, partial [Candidatus Falkowbacteria bacterium RBG_13_39_14]
GYGKEGKKTEKYLKLKYPYIKIGIADKKNNDDYLKKQRGYDLIIKTPGIPKEKVFRSYTTATNIFFSEAEKMKRDGNNIVTIGITGSKGKSTTSSLIHAILKEAGKNAELIGNIGRPMLEALSKPIKKDTVFVLEMSSYQLDDIKFSPDIAVILNLFPDHMPYHHGIENYYSSKKNIMKFQDERGVFIYNSKYKLLKKWAKEAMGKTIAYNEVPGFQKTEKYLHSRAAVLPSVATDRRDCGGTDDDIFSATNLIGGHNIENIKAAMTVAKLFSISDKIIEKALKEFKPLPHRLEFVGEFKGIKFYNDSISTTPESAIAAIEALNASSSRDGACPVSTNKHPISTILLGGEDRGYDFKNLEKTIKRRQIKNIVLFPDTGKRIFKSKKDRVGLNVLETGSMREAIKFAYKNCPPNSICLLSPASPSHNLWENFEERGEEFRKWVRKIHLNYNSPIRLRT